MTDALESVHIHRIVTRAKPTCANLWLPAYLWVDLILKPLDWVSISYVPLPIHLTHLSPSPGPFELPALARNVRLAALEWPAKVLDGLAVVPLAPQQDSVRAGRSTESELVEGEALAAGSDDALASGDREAEGSDGELGNLGETLVIEDGANGHDGLGIVGVGASGLLDNAGDGDGRAVDLCRCEQTVVLGYNVTYLAHKEPFEDDAVEA